MTATIPPNDFTHLVRDVSQFAADCDAVTAYRATHLPAEPDASLSPYPLFVPPDRISELYELFAALHPALAGIVRAWWSKPEWHAAIPLPGKIARVLRAVDAVRDYEHIGSIRPDYIIPPAGPLRVCEINARFLFNGHFHAVLHDQALEALGFTGEWQPSTITGQDMVDAFAALADPRETINVVASTELTHPSHVFGLTPYLRSHPSSRVVDPAALRVDAEGNLTDGEGRLDQVLLQLHQHQLEALDEDVLVALGLVCYNDLRTIYLVHDKRLLGLIRQELPRLVSAGIIDTHQAEVLERGLAETYFPASAGYAATASEPKDEWTLKKAISGKGDGMVFGKNVSEAEWGELVAAKTHLLQRYYPSKRIELLVRDRAVAEPTPKAVTWPFVGTLLVINRRVLGISVFRANDNDTIALSTSGTAIAGVTVPGVPRSFVLPERAQYLAPPPSASINVPPGLGCPKPYLEKVRAALDEHGMAILRLPTHEQDPTSSHLAAIAQALGTPISHSSSHGILWDVTPSPKASSGARSHGADVFPWHTDCSFEAAPPRYFGLHVVRPDRFQGGNLRLLRVSDLVARLSADTIAALQSPHFRFAVPPEFDKGESETTGRVLTPGGKMRWRRDIMRGTRPAAMAALEEVDRVLEVLPGRVLGKNEMKAGVVVLVDNAKWLHARSTVHDMTRLLRRVRWEPEEFSLAWKNETRLLSRE